MQDDENLEILGSEETLLTFENRYGLYEFEKGGFEGKLINALSDSYKHGRKNNTIALNIELRPAQKKILERIEGYNRAVVVAHRRLGKTLLLITNMFVEAYNYDISSRTLKSPPVFAFIAPTIDHAKQLAGNYLAELAARIPGITYRKSDGELLIHHNGVKIILAGAHRPNNLRGRGFVYVVFDEYAYMNSDIWTSVVEPAMEEPGSIAIFSSTPHGTDAFYRLFLHANESRDWGWVHLPNSQTGIHSDEVVEAKKKLNPGSYRAEYECDFKAPVEGSYYGELIEDAKLNGRVGKVPYNPAFGVFTAWDIGISDDTAIWFCQIGDNGKSINVIDFLIGKGKSTADWARIIAQKPYRYDCHILPHDGRTRDRGSGKTPESFIREDTQGEVSVMDKVENVNHGIDRVRRIFPMLYFDETKCLQGLNTLSLYRRKRDPAGEDFMDKPHHAHSHTADALRTLADYFELHVGTNHLSARQLTIAEVALAAVHRLHLEHTEPEEDPIDGRDSLDGIGLGL